MRSLGVWYRRKMFVSTKHSITDSPLGYSLLRFAAYVIEIFWLFWRLDAAHKVAQGMLDRMQHNLIFSLQEQDAIAGFQNQPIPDPLRDRGLPFGRDL
jgi:hypothetical protein